MELVEEVDLLIFDISLSLSVQLILVETFFLIFGFRFLLLKFILNFDSKFSFLFILIEDVNLFDLQFFILPFVRVLDLFQIN